MIFCAVGLTGCIQNTHSYGTAGKQYSSEEYRTFWDRELAPIIPNQIVTNAIPYPEINEEFIRKCQKITNRFGRLGFNLCTKYHVVSTRIEGSAITTNGVAYVNLYMPAILNGYERLRQGNYKKWHEAFKSHVLVLYMHELDHLEDDRVGKFSHIDALHEASIFAKTAEHVLVPLVEKYHVPLIAGDGKIYEAWIRSGRNADSPEWIRFMQKMHGEIDGKR